MNLAPIQAAALFDLPDHPTAFQVFSSHLPFQLVGLAVVLGTLCVLYLICSAVARFFRAPAVAPVAPPVPAAPPIDSSSEDAIVAAISAAVAIVLDQPHRVLSIRPAATSSEWLGAWAIEGRFQHFRSHKVR
ncbi:MAG: OadG family transporter subunit [Limisphaerales bacterium]